MDPISRAAALILTGRPVRRVIEASPGPGDDPLASPEFVGSRKDINRLIDRWSENAGVEIQTFQRWKTHPRRVWYCALPPKTRKEYADALEEHFVEDPIYRAADLFLVVYESPEAEQRFRRSIEGRLKPVVIDEIQIDCPLEWDLFLPIKEWKKEPLPDVRLGDTARGK